MNSIVLTDEQKECINNCYSNIHPTLLYKTLDRCDCCNPNYETVDMGDAGIWSKYPIGVSEWNDESLDDILYFTWGGIEGHKASEVKDGSVVFDGDLDRFCGTPGYIYKGYNGTEYAATRYCSNTSFGKDGFTDNLTVLLPEDDACDVNMGSSWRMPTTEEFQTLYNLCNIEWVTNYNGVSGLNGRLFKLKTDESKQLFFPASGICDSSSVNYVGSNGYFWSSSLKVSSPCYGIRLYFSSGYVFPDDSNLRYFGYPVVGILNSNE